MGDRDLWSKLRRMLASPVARGRLHAPADVRPEDYDGIFRRVASKLRSEADRFELARTTVEERYQAFESFPADRRRAVLQSSPPQLLIALAQDLMRRSYAARFEDVRESLRLATRAVEVVEHVGPSGYLSPPLLADLEAEALAYLGNARRIASDLPGAAEALARAERRREAGTWDQALEADLLSKRAALEDGRGEAAEAARLLDREIALRRLLGDPARLAVSLVDRGLKACWDEGPTERACALMKEGSELADDYAPMLIALLGLSEAFARAGQGAEALISLGTAHVLDRLVGLKSFETSYAWVESLALRTLGENTRAARQLEEVRATLEERGRTRLAGVAAMDLLAIYTEQGRYREAQELAAQAWLTFRKEGLDRASRAALLALKKSLREETATGAAAVAIANHLARYQHNRHARLAGRPPGRPADGA